MRLNQMIQELTDIQKRIPGENPEIRIAGLTYGNKFETGVNHIENRTITTAKETTMGLFIEIEEVHG